MKKIGFLALSLMFVTDLLACPYCSGSSQGGKDSNTTLVLGLFILSIYLPFYLIYRMIKKHRALRAENDNTGSAES